MYRSIDLDKVPGFADVNFNKTFYIEFNSRNFSTIKLSAKIKIENE